MKFHLLLDKYKLPGWDEYLFEYDELKKKISEIQTQTHPRTKISNDEVHKIVDLENFQTHKRDFDPIHRSQTTETPSNRTENVNEKYFQSITKFEKFLKDYYDELKPDFLLIENFLKEENKLNESEEGNFLTHIIGTFR